MAWSFESKMSTLFPNNRPSTQPVRCNRREDHDQTGIVRWPRPSVTACLRPNWIAPTDISLYHIGHFCSFMSCASGALGSWQPVGTSSQLTTEQDNRQQHSIRAYLDLKQAAVSVCYIYGALPLPIIINVFAIMCLQGVSKYLMERERGGGDS